MVTILSKTLAELGLSDLLPLFEGQDIDDSVLRELSDADLKDIGIDKLGTRKKLLAVFGNTTGGVVGISVIEESSARISGGTPSKTAATPAEATKDSPWVNTLGMPFVPISRFDTRFCMWPVRVQDYETYCMDSGSKFPEVPFPQESDHPIVGVSYNDAIDFCAWLTGKERSEGKIEEKTVYRLPTDLEWSAAVGLPHESEATPPERHLKAPGYPWGLRWPPPRNAGNYEHERTDQQTSSILQRAQMSEQQFQQCLDVGHTEDEPYMLSLRSKALSYRSLADAWMRSWTQVDAYEFTSGVAEFPQNTVGIKDLGGNVWEWCMDLMPTDNGPIAVARGGSFAIAPHYSLHETSADPSVLGRPLDNAMVYRSSFRHFGKPEAPLRAVEKVGMSETVPCGGMRVVAVTE